MVSAESTPMAVPTDVDNASASAAKELPEEVTKHGTSTVKRPHGD